MHVDTPNVKLFLHLCILILQSHISQMEFSANQLAQIVNGVVDGDGNIKVNTFAKIEEGHPGALSFLANPKYTHHIYDTRSSIVLVRKDFVPEKEISATLIRVDDPYATIAELLTMVSEMMNPRRQGIEQPSYITDGVEIPDDAYIGAFAYIGRGVKIGAGAQIYPQAFIGDNVEIGDNTIIYPGAKIYHGCKIGNRCIIHAGAVVGADGFGFAPTATGYEKIPQLGIVTIEDDVEIGANTTVDRATMGMTRIGKGVKLDNLIQVAHNCAIGENTVMAAQAGIAGSTKVGKNCMFGGQVGLAGHIEIGDNTQIGAQSGVPKSVKADSRLMGTPAVNYGDFARQTAVIKRLPEIVRKLDLKNK